MNLYESPGMWGGEVNAEWILQNYDSSYKVIMVGISPSELRKPGFNWNTRTYGPSGME